MRGVPSPISTRKIIKKLPLPAVYFASPIRTSRGYAGFPDPLSLAGDRLGLSVYGENWALPLRGGNRGLPVTGLIGGGGVSWYGENGGLRLPPDSRSRKGEKGGSDILDPLNCAEKVEGLYSRKELRGTSEGSGFMMLSRSSVVDAVWCRCCLLSSIS
jgi:hypothetical protein